MNNIFASQSVGYRHAFPLLAITSASLLATDIYLPSLPILPEALGGSEFAAQMTLVSFLGLSKQEQIKGIKKAALRSFH